MSNVKAKDYISNAVVAQQQIFDRARKLNTHINAGFADFEVRCVILFASLPSQKKVSKSSQITFLFYLYFIIKDIHQTYPHSTRFNTLTSFCTFMEKVEREANQIISASLNDSRVTVLRTK